MKRPASSFIPLLALVRYILSDLKLEKSISPAERELLARGFALAWFVHQDRDQAEEIAAKAFAQHETVVENHARYHDYSTPRRRTKVQLSPDQYYQHLVLRYSDVQQERELKHTLLLNEDTMLVYFHAFIAFNLFLTNSFRATAANGRLLFRLSANQTRRLVQILNPHDRERGDDEYNRAKMNLYNPLTERFEGRLIPEQLPCNNKSFKERLNPGCLRELSATCLEKFAPWRNKCLLTESIDNPKQLERAFEPDTAEAERDRMHVALHCLRKLAQMVFDQGQEPLIPQFVFTSSRDDPRGSVGPRHSPPQLTEGDYQRLISEASIQRRRRHETLAPVLQCRVDGNVKTEIDLRRSAKSEPIDFTDDDNYLEVWADDLLLATYYLPSVCDLERGLALEDSIMLEGGQRVTFNCSLIEDNEEQQAGSILVQYQETSLVRTLARRWQTCWHSIQQVKVKLHRLLPAALFSILCLW